MQPVEFEVSAIPKKVYWRYCRYAGWSRAQGIIWVFLVLGLVYLGLWGERLFRAPDAWDTSFSTFYLLGIMYISPSLLIPILIFNTRKHILGQQWHYAFSEHAMEADMVGGVFLRWDYYALAYAREAKDAFYLVLNEKTGEGLVIPKEVLTPEQCGALVEVLQRGVPGGKFTRWKGAG